MALGKISSLFGSHKKGKNKNKVPTSSKIHPMHAELKKKKVIEAESQEPTGTEDYTVSQSDGRENSISISITSEFGRNYPQKLENERQDFLINREKWSLREQIAEKDKRILELETRIADLQKKHREEIKSLEEEKRSVIKELGKAIGHYKDRLRDKKWFRHPQ